MTIFTSNITTFYRSIYDIADHARERGLVFYGAGFWGRMACEIFALFNVCPTAFCDDNPEKQGTFFEFHGQNIPILSLDEAAKQMPNAVYIATVTSSRDVHPYRYEMNCRLQERGLLSPDSGFHPVRYLFLLEGGMEAMNNPLPLAKDSFQPEHLSNMVVLNHMSDSGSVFFGTLMDGHPNVVNVPLLGDFVPLQELYLKRLQYLEGKELVVETASQLHPFFSTEFPDEVYFHQTSRLVDSYYCDQNGVREERVYVSPNKLVSALNRALIDKGHVSYAMLLKSIFAAYQNAIGGQYVAGKDYWMFFMRHKANYDLCEMDDLLAKGDFKRLEYWFIIREPVQHTYSWIKRWIFEAAENMKFSFISRPQEYLDRFSCDLGLMVEKNNKNRDKTVRVIRFEDTKLRLRDTMRAVCRCLQIPFDECLLEATANGVPVYFPRSYNGKAANAISTNDRTAVDRRDYSSLMSTYDVFRLELVYQNFKRTYGYASDVPDYRQFSDAFLEELYREPFRFEETLDREGRDAFAKGFFTPGERVGCHTYLTELFLNYMKRDVPELFADVITPKDDEE